MDIFYALSDPTRRKILELLASQGKLSASDISAQFPVSPPAISQHLKVLRDARLVKMEKRAQQRIYRINPQAFRELERWTRQLTQQWNQRLDALDELLKVEKNKNWDTTRKVDKMNKEITIKRTFDAPRELVFKAWTDPDLISRWWGPTGFTTPISEVEPRLGGKLYIVMHGPKGSDFDEDMPIKGVFQEFDPPQHIVFTNGAMFDENGEPQLSTLCTVDFVELGSKTEMTLHIELLNLTPVSEAPWAGAEIGWNMSLDKLNEVLLTLKEGYGRTKTVLP